MNHTSSRHHEPRVGNARPRHVAPLGLVALFTAILTCLVAVPSAQAAAGTVTLKGHLTNSHGYRIPGTVWAYTSVDGVPQQIGSFATVGSTTGYTLTVPAGEPVTVLGQGDVYSGHPSVWTPTWLGDTSNVEEITFVSPAEGETVTDLDIAVQGGAPVTGSVQVVDVNGSTTFPEGVTVTAYRDGSPAVVATALTDTNGAFDVDGIGPLWTVRLQFSGPGLVTTDRPGTIFLRADGSGGSAGSQAVAIDPGYPRLTATTAPSISGTAGPGGTLSVTPGTWTYAGELDRSYQWTCNSVPLDGATGASYQVQPADEGCTFSVTEKVSAPDRRPQAASAPWVYYEPRMQLAGPVEVTGSGVVGQTLAAAVSWTLPPEQVTYQWYRDEQPISGATAGAYRLTKADAGRSISVYVTGTRVRGTASEQSAGVRVRARSDLSATAKPTRTGAQLRISLGTPGISAPGGTLRVVEHGKVLATRQVTEALDKPWVAKAHLRPGRHTLTVTYRGSRTATAASDGVTVRVPRP